MSALCSVAPELLRLWSAAPVLLRSAWLVIRQHQGMYALESRMAWSESGLHNAWIPLGTLGTQAATGNPEVQAIGS